MIIPIITIAIIPIVYIQLHTANITWYILRITVVMRGMQTYADCCVEAFIFIRCTEQVQVNYKDKDQKNDI